MRSICLKADISISVETMADAFAQMKAEEQARFLAAVAKRFAASHALPHAQAHFIGARIRSEGLHEADALLREILE